MTSGFSSNLHAPRSASQDPRADGEAIDWANVAVETAVMLRLQDAPPVAAAQARRREGEPEG
jgi:hypothetical protein